MTESLALPEWERCGELQRHFVRSNVGLRVSRERKSFEFSSLVKSDQ